MKIKFPVLFLLLILLTSFSVGAHSSPPTILVLGDSLSAAFGIPQNRGWVALLQARLKHAGYPHKVVNASVSGETTAGGAARAEKLLATYMPQILVLELGSNDGLRGLSLNIMKTNLNKIITQAKQHNTQVVIIGMQLPPNYGPAYTRMFHDIYKQLARTHQLPWVPFLFAGLEDNTKYFQSDKLHPTALAQPILLDNVWPAISPLISRH